MPIDADGDWHPYHYSPSLAAAATAAGLFALSTIHHSYQVLKNRTWYFVPLVVGGLLEAVGFIARILSRGNEYSELTPFIIQSIFILIAPTFFAASIYIVLGRIILLVEGERYSFIRQRHLTVFFVLGDVLSLNLQSLGGGIVSGDNPTAVKLGEIIIVVGLMVQLAFFGLFIAAAGFFHHRLINNNPVKKHIEFTILRSIWHKTFRCNWKRKGKRTTLSSAMTSTNIDLLPWKRHLYVLYTTSGLVLVRIYVLDAALMFVVMALFNWTHPSEITEPYKARIKESNGAVIQVELQERGGLDISDGIN